MAEVKWIKLVTDLFDNRKIKQIEVLPEGDAIIVIWMKLLCLAGNINDSGYVYFTNEIPYTDQMLSTQFNRPLTTIQLALKTFEQFGMIEIIDDMLRISNWEKYQSVDKMAEIREYNRLAKQKSREKQRLSKGVNDKSMTSQLCQGTDIDKDIDKDIDINSNTGGDAPKPPKPKQEHSFVKHTNVQNLDYVITHNDLTVNPDLYSIITDWMEYKDQKKKGQNHYDTEKGITTLITKFTKNCNEYGLDAVRHAVEESIANNYQGIVWEKAQQFKGGKGNYTYKPQQTTTDLDPQITAQLRALEEQQLASMPDVANMSDEDIDKLIRGEL